MSYKFLILNGLRPTPVGAPAGQFHGLTALLATAAMLLCTGPSPGQCEIDRLVPSDPDNTGYFGYSLDMSSPFAIVGAPRSDDCGSNSGVAILFGNDGSGWVEKHRLRGTENEQFGCSVSISGDVAIIGALGNDDHGEGAGAAYIFRYTGSFWEWDASLSASDGMPTDKFGAEVAIDGDVAVVGAYLDDNDNGTNAGSAYVFNWNGQDWVEEAQLLASDGFSSHFFGAGVAVSGNTVVVGAHRAPGNNGSGNAYVFRRVGSQWIEQARLVPSDGAMYDEFGLDVAIDGNVVVVGAAEHDFGVDDTGAAYVFRYDGSDWVEEAALHAPDPKLEDYFGTSVAIESDVIVIGSLRDDHLAPDAGAAFLFRHDNATWALETTLVASDGAEYDRFAADLALEDGYLLAGSAYYYDAGCAYLIDLDGPDCNFNRLCDDRDIDSGFSDDDNYNGIPDECDRWCEVDWWIAPDGGPFGLFGEAVAIHGPVALVGEYLDDHNGTDSGSCHVWRYHDSIWSAEATLNASDGQPFDLLGCSVDIHGDIAVAGAYGDDDSGQWSGSAYVFRYADYGWAQEAKLVPADGAAGDWAGWSVAAEDDVIIVGAFRDDDQGEDSGSAYVFRFDGQDWVEEAKLLPSTGAAGDGFGCAVAVAGEVAVIGAEGDDTAGKNAGACCIFRFNGSEWVEEARLLRTNGVAGDLFGNAVAAYGDAVLVGALMADDNGEDAGAAHLYRYDGMSWVEEAQLLASNGEPDDRFGSSVTIDLDLALVGAPRRDTLFPNDGSVFAYRFDGAQWIEYVELASPAGLEGDSYGAAIDVNGDNAIIGAPFDDDGGSQAGSVFLIAGLTTEDCNENGISDACDIAGGTSEDANANGIPDECECLADLNGDGKVNIDDVFAVLGAWGPCP
ncbi:MAG: FG-GAP repeat protein [Phycisphaerales bacterium]|nr:MAG: FG-GAP repeat protein [Phycisphaerales bacterium]